MDSKDLRMLTWLPKMGQPLVLTSDADATAIQNMAGGEELFYQLS